MADDALRRAERRARGGGAVERSRELLERVRVGLTSMHRLEIAARCGSSEAREALELAGVSPPARDHLKPGRIAFGSLVEGFGEDREAVVRLILACVYLELARLGEPTRRGREILYAVERWALLPSEDRADAVVAALNRTVLSGGEILDAAMAVSAPWDSGGKYLTPRALSYACIEGLVERGVDGMRLLGAIEQDLIAWGLGEPDPILPRHLDVGRIERLTRRQIVDYLRDQFGVEARSSWKKAELVGLLEEAVQRSQRQPEASERRLRHQP